MIMDECKPLCMPASKDLFQEYLPRNPSAANVHVIRNALKTFKKVGDDVYALLIDFMNEFV